MTKGQLKRNSLLKRDQEKDCTGWPTESPIRNVIVIGTSAGGHKALWEVVRQLSTDIPAAIIIMQHRAIGTNIGVMSFRMDEWLGNATRIPVVQVQSGQRLQAGAIYVPPAGMSVSLKSQTLHISPQTREIPVSTIKTLFESAAREFHDLVIGVVLTGLLKDGTMGLKAIHYAGGLTIVQDPSEAEFPDMPASAMKDVPVTFCLKLEDIGPTLDLLARRNSELETGLSASVRVLKQRVSLLVRLIAQSHRNPHIHEFLSTELIALDGVLRSIQNLVSKTLAEKVSSRKLMKDME